MVVWWFPDNGPQALGSTQIGIQLVNQLILRATPSAAGLLCLLGIVTWGLGHSMWHSRGHFGTSGAAWGIGISGAPWGGILILRKHAGGPWEQQDGHEVANDKIFGDSGMISRPVHVSFCGSKC